VEENSSRKREGKEKGKHRNGNKENGRKRERERERDLHFLSFLCLLDFSVDSSQLHSTGVHLPVGVTLVKENVQKRLRIERVSTKKEEGREREREKERKREREEREKRENRSLTRAPEMRATKMKKMSWYA
jgi:hypothetical protein